MIDNGCVIGYNANNPDKVRISCFMTRVTASLTQSNIARAMRRFSKSAYLVRVVATAEPAHCV